MTATTPSRYPDLTTPATTHELASLEEYRRAADTDKSSSDGIQLRANTVLGFTATILALTLGIDYPTVLAHGDFGVPAVTLLLITIALAVGAVMIPECETVDSKLLEAQPLKTVAEILDLHRSLRETNSLRLNWKRFLLNGAIVFLALGIGFLVASIMQSGITYPGF